MYLLFTILTIISFYSSLAIMITIYVTKNKKLKILMFILFGLTLILFTIWGFYRNLNHPDWYLKKILSELN